MHQGKYNYTACSKCGGQCCQRSAGIYSPTDFSHLEKIDVASVLIILANDNCIDKLDGEEIYFLRPRQLSEGEVAFTYGGVCVKWNEKTGCILSENKRPYQCRMLVPNFIPGAKIQFCYDAPDKFDMAELWKPYQEILKEVVAMFI